MTSPTNSICPVCHSPTITSVRSDLYDDRYGYPGAFRLWHCTACDHRFLDARFSSEALARLYSEYYPRKQFDLETWKPHREYGAFRTWIGRERSAVFRWVPRQVKVLDVGCGFGQTLGYHHGRGCETQGIDPDENLARVAKRYGLDARVGLFRGADYPADYFDYVTLDQVIEHAAEPIQLLRDARAVVRPGGRVLVSTPNARSLTARWLGTRWVHFHAPFHLQLFSAQSLAKAAEIAGLRIVCLRMLTHPRWYGFQWLHLLARGKAGAPSPFWSRAVPWPRWKIWPRRLIAGVGRIGGNHLLGFALDTLRLGDNLVAEFERPRD